jgi:DNA-binding Lrp family transcriptional regulator
LCFHKQLVVLISWEFPRATGFQHSDPKLSTAIWAHGSCSTNLAGNRYVARRREPALMDEILKLLQRDALESRETIAKLLNLPLTDVNQRIADYEKSGVIRGYQAVLDEDKLDLDRVTAVIEVKVTPQREGGFNQIAQRISKFPEVRSAYLMSGAYDLLLFVEGRSLRDVAAFVSERLSPLEGVISTSTHFMLKTYKRFGVLMHQESPDERLSISP